MSRFANPVITHLGEVLENLAFLIPQGEVPPPAAWDRVLEVRFQQIGTDLMGRVWIALGDGVAAEAVRNMAALDPDADIAEQDLTETAAELANVLAGNLLPRLVDEGAGFDLAQPRTVREEELPEQFGVCLDLGSGVLGIAIDPDLA